MSLVSEELLSLEVHATAETAISVLCVYHSYPLAETLASVADDDDEDDANDDDVDDDDDDDEDDANDDDVDANDDDVDDDDDDHIVTRSTIEVYTCITLGKRKEKTQPPRGGSWRTMSMQLALYIVGRTAYVHVRDDAYVHVRDDAYVNVRDACINSTSRIHMSVPDDLRIISCLGGP